MTGERYLTYLVKVQGSPDPILIHSAGSELVNIRNGLGHRVKKDFVYQELEESATAFEVDLTKMLLRRNKKGRMPFTETLKSKTAAEIEALQIPAATREQNNKNVDFTNYTPVTPFIIKKIVEENSSTSQEISVSCVKALKSFGPTQADIDTLINTPDTTAPEVQTTAAPAHTTGEEITTKEGQAGYQTEEYVVDTAKKKNHHTGRDGRKWARQNPSNSSDIIFWIPDPILAESIPRTGIIQKI